MTIAALPVIDERLGILLRILSTLAFATMGVCIKALGDVIPLGQVVFFRSAFALLPLVIFLWWCGDWPRGLVTRHPVGHVVRCLLGATAMFTSFATIRLLPLAEATMLSYLAPVMLALLGWAYLGEQLTTRRVASIALGLSGGAVFCLPAFTSVGVLSDAAALGLGLGLVTAALTAGALVQVRKLTLAGEGAGAIAFWFAVTSALGGLTTLPMGWVWPSPATGGLLICTGLAGGIAHILMTLSFRHAGAVALAPFEYISVLWAVAFGFLFFAEVPSGTFLTAGTLILAGAYVALPSRTR